MSEILNDVPGVLFRIQRDRVSNVEPFELGKFLFRGRGGKSNQRRLKFETRRHCKRTGTPCCREILLNLTKETYTERETKFKEKRNVGPTMPDRIHLKVLNFKSRYNEQLEIFKKTFLYVK